MRPAGDGPLCHAVGQALHRAWRAVWRPLADRIGESGLVVVTPCGPLQGLPFPALWTGRQHLIERHAFLQTPSGASFAALSRRRPSPGGRPVCVGVADENAPRAGEEARLVAGLLDADLLHQHEATRAAVLKAVEGAPICHFACHGRFSQAHPMASGLRLSDGWLGLHDLAELRLTAELVTLSACDTGRGQARAGNEQVGLVRSLLVGGAGSVLACQWPLHDESAERLLADFYEGWRSRRYNFSEALRHAQRNLIDRSPHAAFWAGLYLTGGFSEASP
jgi:CHAT domain-containing protein